MHVRMAERSKAPDSRVTLFQCNTWSISNVILGVFWSTNVGVGSNPTPDRLAVCMNCYTLCRSINRLATKDIHRAGFEPAS